MKRIYSYILSALLAVAFTTAHAQQNIFVWLKGGTLYVTSTDVDSLSFSEDKSLFDISYWGRTNVYNRWITGTVRVSWPDNVANFPIKPEVGICYSSTHTVPTCADDNKSLGELSSNSESYSFAFNDLISGTTYYYRAYVKFGDGLYYGDVMSATTSGEKPQDAIINGHKFVDLGLPSSLLWAEANVGASSATDSGDYYAWGEIETKDDYSWSTYKWGSEYNPSKYNTSDGKTALESEDDVATVKWGKGCRIPSYSDFQELKENCDWSRKEDYQGTSGYLVTGKNGRTIFFPASGYRKGDGSISESGEKGRYWSRSHYTECGYEYEYDKFGAYFLSFPGFYINYEEHNSRAFGFSVRPVAER